MSKFNNIENQDRVKRQFDRFRDDKPDDGMNVLLIRAFLFVFGIAFLTGGIALVYYPPAQYLEVLGGLFVIVSLYLLWLAGFADQEIVKKRAIELLDRLF